MIKMVINLVIKWFYRHFKRFQNDYYITKQIQLIFLNYYQFDSNSKVTHTFVITIVFTFTIQERHRGIKIQKYIEEKDMEKILTFEFLTFWTLCVNFSLLNFNHKLWQWNENILPNLFKNKLMHFISIQKTEFYVFKILVSIWHSNILKKMHSLQLKRLKKSINVYIS